MMSEKVVGLRGALVPQAMGANPDVVRMLEDMLERARSGQILGVSAVLQESDECCGTRRAGLISYRLLGFATAMLDDMNEDLKKL
jgi:hypothetical protein